MSTARATVTSGTDADLPRLRDTVLSLTAGTVLFVVAFGALAWVWGALRFVADGLWPAFGVFAMSVLAVLLFAYGWALLVRGLTEVVARGVADGMAR